MKVHSSIPRIWRKSVIVSAAALVTAVAFAQSAPTPPTGPHPARPGMEHGMQHPDMDHEHGGFFMPHQLAGLKTSLHLTPQQTALWDKAEKAMTPPPDARAKMEEMMKAHHAQALAALADPKFDPRKFAAEQEKQRDEMQAQRKARMNTIQEAWFTVYDSLDAGQRGQVREFLRTRFEMRAKAWHHHGERDGMKGEHGDRKDEHASSSHEGTYFKQSLPSDAIAKPLVKMS